MYAHELSSRKNAETLLPLPASSLSVSLLYVTLPALLFPMNAASSALCVLLLSPSVTASSSFEPVFVNPPFPYKTFLPLMFHSYLLPIILYPFPHIYFCALPFYVSLLAVKNLVLLFLLIIVKRGESYGEMG